MPVWTPAIRNMVATELLATDPAEAESIVDAIASPETRAWGYVRLAEALPDDGASSEAQVPGARHGSGPRSRGWRARGRPSSRLSELGQVAGGWLNLGEVDKARPLIREGLELVAALPQSLERSTIGFPVDRGADRARSGVVPHPGPQQRRSSAGPATPRSLNRWRTSIRPKRSVVFQLIDDSSRTAAAKTGSRIALRLCRRMAKTDPERARRIIAGLETPRDQACGWALLALGLADRDKPAARSALAESIQAIDRLLDSAEP